MKSIDLTRIEDKDILNILRKMDLETLTRARQMNSGIWHFVQENGGNLAARSNFFSCNLQIEVTPKKTNSKETMKWDLIFTLHKFRKGSEQPPFNLSIENPEVELSGVFFESISIVDYVPKPKTWTCPCDMQELPMLNLKCGSLKIEMCSPKNPHPRELIKHIRFPKIIINDYYRIQELNTWPIYCCEQIIVEASLAIPITLSPLVDIMPNIYLKFERESPGTTNLIMKFLDNSRKDRRARGILTELSISFKKNTKILANLICKLPKVTHIWDGFDSLHNPCSISSKDVDGAIAYFLISNDIITIKFSMDQGKDTVIQDFFKKFVLSIP